MFAAPTVDDGCRFRHHLWRRVWDLSKILVAVELNLLHGYFNYLYKPSQSGLGQPLWMAAHASDWGDSLNRRRKGEGANGTPWWWCLCGEFCWCLTDFSYYFYHRKSMGREFFVPTRTLIGVKLLRMHFSTQWSPNSQFWLYSCMWQCCPCATGKPKIVCVT